MHGLYKRINRRYERYQTFKACWLTDKLAIVRAVIKSNLSDYYKVFYLEMFFTDQIAIISLMNILMNYRNGCDLHEKADY